MELTAEPPKEAMRLAISAALAVPSALVDRVAIHNKTDGRRLAPRRAVGTTTFVVDAEVVVPSNLTVDTIKSRTAHFVTPASKPQKALVQHLQDFGAIPNSVKQVIPPRSFQALVINASTEGHSTDGHAPVPAPAGSPESGIDQGDGSMPIGAIVGGSVGGAMGLLAVIALLCCLCKKEQKFEA